MSYSNLLGEVAPAKHNSLSAEERNALVLSCERMCIGIARKAVHGARGLDVDDLTQEAMVSCVEASKRWDPTRGVKFSSYAHKCIARDVNKIVVAHRSKGEVQSEDWDGFVDPQTADGPTTPGREFTPEQLAAIDRLPETARLVVRLVLDDGLSPARIADQVGLGIKDVKLVLRNAAAQLRKDLAFFNRPALFDLCGAPDEDAA